MTGRGMPRSYPLFAAQALVFALLAVFGGLFIYCAAQRIPYPFEIEWLEGEMLSHALRLLQGLPIYAPPSLSFIAEIYPPVFYYVSAAVFKIAGAVSFPLLRLVSVASLVGILVLLYRLVRHEEGTRGTALLATGLFLSFYEIHGPWYDIGRVDMLFFFFIISGLYVLAYGRRRYTAMTAGAVLLMVACYTKQSAVYYLPFAFVYVALQNRRQALVLGALFAVLVPGAFLALNAANDGWFATYTLLNPLHYNELLSKPISEIPFKMLFEYRDRLMPEIRYEIFYKLPVLFTLAAGYLIHRAVSLRKSSRLNIWEVTALPSIISYFSIRPHLGSEKNDFMYLTLWGCMLAGFMLTRLAQACRDDRRQSIRTTVYLLLAGQLALQVYNPLPLVPAPGSAEKGRQFISMIKNIPGQVFLPYHSYYGVMAGKEMVFNGGAYWAWQILSREPYRPEGLIEKIRRKEIPAIILDERGYITAKGERVYIDMVKMLIDSGDEVALAVQENYQPGWRIPYADDDQFCTRTGLITRPSLVAVPKP